MKLTCFSLIDFQRSGGATVRISGVLNALVSQGVEISFYSRSDKVSELHSSIEIVKLDQKISQVSKRQFQFLLAHFPVGIVNSLYREELAIFKETFQNLSENTPILFFEYLDISLGYWLWKNDVIPSYLTDVHGIAPLEFELNERKSVKKTMVNKLKKYTSSVLDKKIYTNAEAIVYPSKGVCDFMQQRYNLSKVNSMIVEESINPLLVAQTVNETLLSEIENEIDLNDEDTVFFFAGSFKEFGGISDLVKAFIKLTNTTLKSIKLVLVGDGQLEDYCKELVSNACLSEKVYFFGRQPYESLKTFHQISDIIVCPDKDTTYSQLLPHIKYYDSIISGKIVINGEFAFTEELNPNEQFSLNFTPSNIDSLVHTMKKALVNKEKLMKKYELNSKIALDRFSYENNIGELYDYLKSRVDRLLNQ